MRFPQNPEMETLTFEAALFIGGDNEYDAHIRYTPRFQMNHADLADILHDAYYDGSVNEEAFAEWEDLKHERRLFQERMDYLATESWTARRAPSSRLCQTTCSASTPERWGTQSPAWKPSQKTAMGRSLHGVHPARTGEREDGNTELANERPGP